MDGGERRMRMLTRTTAPPKARRRPRRRAAWHRLKLAARTAVPLLVLGLFVGATGWSWWTGRLQAATEEGIRTAIAASAELGLTVERVYVLGRERSLRDQVLKALTLERGQPILAFGPAAAKARLEALSWIGSAVVERHLPDTIHVRLAERRPMALWQRDGRLVLVDPTGAVIVTDGLEQFAHLPVIVGDDAPEHAPALLALLATEPELGRRVVAAVRVGGRRWNLRFAGGIDVRLPEENAAQAWARLAELERKQRLLERDVIVVDMRLPDRLVVRTTPEAAHMARDPGEHT